MFDWTYKLSAIIVPPDARKEKPMNPTSLPTLPTWENLHPLMVHFPLVLLTIAGVPLLMSLVWSKQRTTLLMIAAAMFVAGTIAAFLALATGDAAEHAANMSREIHCAAHKHEEMAELTRNVFIVESLLSVALAVAAMKIGTGPKAKFVVVGSVLAVLGWGFGSLALANTGHLGALLVHEYGVHANLDNSISSDNSQTQAPAPSGEKREEQPH